MPLNNQGLTTNGFFNHKITWARLHHRRGRPASLKGLVILVDQEDGLSKMMSLFTVGPFFDGVRIRKNDTFRTLVSIRKH